LLEHFQSLLIRTHVPMDHAKKGCQATEVKLHTLLTWALNVGKFQCSDALRPGEDYPVTW